MVLASLGMVLLAQIGVHSTYAGHILPALLIIGLGLGLIFAPSINTATLGVSQDDAGVGVRHREQLPAGRRLDRHRVPEHDRDDRGGELSRRQGPVAGGRGPGRCARLHGRVLVGGGYLRCSAPWFRGRCCAPAWPPPWPSDESQPCGGGVTTSGHDLRVLWRRRQLDRAAGRGAARVAVHRPRDPRAGGGAPGRPGRARPRPRRGRRAPLHAAAGSAPEHERRGRARGDVAGVLPRDRAPPDRGRRRRRGRRARTRRRDRAGRPGRRVPRPPRRSPGAPRVPGDARRGRRRARGQAPAAELRFAPASTTSSTSTAAIPAMRATTTLCSTRPRCRWRRASS